MKSLAILYNPQSGSGDKEALIQELVAFLEEHGVDRERISIYATESANHAFELAKYASHSGVDMVISLGGDGTINKIAAGIYEGGGHAVLGLLPSGTVNNFAKAMRIPLSRKDAMENLIKGHPQSVDLCRVNDRYMISSLTLGILADIAVKVKQEEKRQLGPLAFIKYASKILRRNRNYYLTLDYEGKRIREKTKILLITMTNSVAGLVNFDQKARPDDGLMSVYLLTDLNVMEMLREWPSLVQGRFADLKEVRHFRTSHLRIEQYRHKNIQRARTRIDGDKSAYLPIELEVLPKAIQVMVPNDQS